jgi:hypothetical protein
VTRGSASAIQQVRWRAAAPNRRHGAPDFRRLAISDRAPEASSIVLAFGWKAAHHPLAPIISDPVLEQEIMGSIR